MNNQKVIDAVSEITGHPFEPMWYQNQILDEGQTEDGVIGLLRSQLDYTRKQVADSFPDLTPSDIPLYLLTNTLVLNRATKRVSGDKLSKLTPQALVEIGRIIERKFAQPQKGLVEMCYEDILQRESDIEGFKHYQDRIDAGGPNNSTLDLVRDIYWSPEAVKLRGIGHI